MYDLAEFNRRAQSAVSLEEAKLMLNNPDAASALASKKLDTSSGQKSREGSKRKMTISKEMGIRRRNGTTSMFPYTKYTPS